MNNEEAKQPEVTKPEPLPPTNADLRKEIAALQKQLADGDGLTKKEIQEIRAEIGALKKQLEPKAPDAPALAPRKALPWW